MCCNSLLPVLERLIPMNHSKDGVWVKGEATWLKKMIGVGCWAHSGQGMQPMPVLMVSSCELLVRMESEMHFSE